MSRGFFAVGIYHPKREVNVGTLWRSAHLYGAAYVFTIGRRYESQSSDTPKTPLHTPLMHFATFDTMRDALPHRTPLVGVELDDRAIPLPEFTHPERAVYLLGAEDNGLPEYVLNGCHSVVQIPTPAPQSMNVSAAGTVLLYDRDVKVRARKAVAA